MLGAQVTCPNQILLAPTVLESIPGFLTMPRVWVVVLGSWVPWITRISLPLIEVLMLQLPAKLSLDYLDQADSPEYRTLWDASKLSLFYQILELLHDFQVHLCRGSLWADK